MKWLGEEPRVKTGVSFGAPWQQGKLWPGNVSGLVVQDDSVPHEARILAKWPDGSVKWTAHAAVIRPGASASVLNPLVGGLKPATAWRGESPNLAEARGGNIRVDNGVFRLVVPGRGEALADEVTSPSGKLLASRLRLVVGAKDARVEVSGATIETPGKVRTVIRLEGRVEAEPGRLLDFIVRLTVFAGLPTLNITKTILFHDVSKDRTIKGLGIALDRPLDGDLLNRRVSVAGDSSVYSEPVQSLFSRAFTRDNSVYAQQLAGVPVQESPETAPVFSMARKNAVWSGFRVTQESEDYFRVEKQTRAKLLRIRIGKGHRSAGLLYAGDAGGGIALSLRNFWQKFPAALEVSGMDMESASLTAWSWAESVEPMDLRHYSDECYVDSAYEGFEHLASTPEGIANTSHLAFDFLDSTPTHSALWDLALERQEPAQPVFPPETYCATKAAGTAWGLPESSFSPDSREPGIGGLLERRMAEVVEFYRQEVEQRSWYGYWNFGDFMHSYDQYRHQWRYDLGGYAWANNELAPSMWLWQHFLRTGDSHAYRLAEAMTWHSAEVDRHHFGEYAQLGSRHNVVHWGCSCKEVRISMAGLHSQFYFLTGDERIGELLSEVRNAEQTFAPSRTRKGSEDLAFEPARIRIGPDWAALTSNWYTEWERTGDKQWRDKILEGIRQLERMPLGMLSGPTVAFDVTTGKMELGNFAETKQFHMVIAFGAPQVWSDIAESLDHDGFRRMIADFGRFYSLPDADKRRISGSTLTDDDFSWPYMAAGIMAYGAWYYHDEKLAAAVWEILLTNADLDTPLKTLQQQGQTWRPVTELPWISTNWASQWCLNVMLALRLIGPPGTPRWAPAPGQPVEVH